MDAWSTSKTAHLGASLPSPPDPVLHTRSTVRACGKSAPVELVVSRVDRDAVSALCHRLRSLIDQSHARLIICDVSILRPCDLMAIDALARLGLTARRLGCSIQLQGGSDDLLALIAFAGLQAVLPVSRA
jgi:ABC-type transporter Mla MlaB component